MSCSCTNNPMRASSASCSFWSSEPCSYSKMTIWLFSSTIQAISSASIARLAEGDLDIVHRDLEVLVLFAVHGLRDLVPLVEELDLVGIHDAEVLVDLVVGHLHLGERRRVHHENGISTSSYSSPMTAALTLDEMMTAVKLFDVVRIVLVIGHIDVEVLVLEQVFDVLVASAEVVRVADNEQDFLVLVGRRRRRYPGPEGQEGGDARIDHRRNRGRRGRRGDDRGVDARRGSRWAAAGGTGVGGRRDRRGNRRRRRSDGRRCTASGVLGMQAPVESPARSRASAPALGAEALRALTLALQREWMVGSWCLFSGLGLCEAFDLVSVQPSKCRAVVVTTPRAYLGQVKIASFRLNGYVFIDKSRSVNSETVKLGSFTTGPPPPGEGRGGQV